MSKQRANDLGELNVDIELFPMPKPDAGEDGEPPSFDIKKFYANIISFDEDQQLSDMLGFERT